MFRDGPKVKRKSEGVEDKRMQYECENEWMGMQDLK